MSDTRGFRLAWLFVALALLAAALLLSGAPYAGATEEQDEVRQLRNRGDIIPLVDLLSRTELAEFRVLEVELEREHGRLVYELELLDPDGRVQERSYDAVSGRPLMEHEED